MTVLETSVPPVSAEPFTLGALDGYPLAATRFEAVGQRRGNLIVAGATAVAQPFYRRFAEHAARRGFTTLTLDYRGLGKSRPEDLRSFDPDLLDWARLDLAAAVDYFAPDGVPLFLVGHSYGGHALGLLPNHHRIARFYVFGTGSGWDGFIPGVERVKVLLMWHVVLPILTAWKGYCPWSMLGLGEDLPRRAYQQWRRWCGMEHYFFDDPEMKGLEKEFERVKVPIVAANSLDDLWALPRSRDAFISAYRNAEITRVNIDPKTFGAIGHMGYFRQKAQPLWDDVLDWFGDSTSAPGSTTGSE